VLLSCHPQIRAVEVDEVNLPRDDSIAPKGIASAALSKVQSIDLFQALTMFISHSYQLALPFTSEEVEATVATLIKEGFFKREHAQIPILMSGEIVLNEAFIYKIDPILLRL
jgi:hypothetical protein